MKCIGIAAHLFLIALLLFSNGGCCESSSLMELLEEEQEMDYKQMFLFSLEYSQSGTEVDVSDVLNVVESWHGPIPTPTPPPADPTATPALPTPTPLAATHGGFGIAADNSDNLYVIDFVSVYRVPLSGEDVLYKDLGPGGENILTVQSTNADIAYDSVKNRLYVSGPAQIARIDLFGGATSLFAYVVGTGKDIQGLCADGLGNLYVARKDAVLKYDEDGVETNLGWNQGITWQPCDIAIGPDGSLYVTALHYGMYGKKVNWEGALFVKRPGGSWFNAIQYFAGPCYITYHPNGRLYISNMKADVVSVVHPSSLNVEGFFEVDVWPRGIAVLSGETLAVAHVKSLNDTQPVVSLYESSARTLIEQRPLISLSHITLEGHTLQLGVRGTGLDFKVPAHNSVRLGAQRLQIVGYDMDAPEYGLNLPEVPSITVELPLLGLPTVVNPVAYVLPEGDITVEQSGLVSNAASISGPLPGQLGQTLYLNQNVSEALPEEMAKGSWIRLWADGNFTIEFPDGPYPDRALQVSDSYFINLSQLGTFRLSVPAWGKTYQTEVVTAAPSFSARTEVDPSEAFTWFWNGATIEIPAGTLPSRSEPYDLLLQCNPANPMISYLCAAPTFQVTFDPEPERLNHAISISIPYRGADLGIDDSAVRFGLYDPAGVYADFNDYAQDLEHSRFNVTMPAGVYGTGSAARSILAAAGSTLDPKSYTVNTVLSFGSWGLPTSSYQLAGEDFIVQAGGDIPSAYAEACLSALRASASVYEGLGFELPPQPFFVWISDMGDQSTLGGITTKGIFGQPWVTINSGLSTDGGRDLDWNVAHEFFHACQRQITTNLLLHWTDEATAQWAASRVYPDSTYYLDGINGLHNGDGDFIKVSIPDTFNYMGSSYNTGQIYTAMAMMKYLVEKAGSQSIKVLMVYDSTNAGLNFRDSLAQVSGETIGQFSRGLSKAFWTLGYDKAKDHNWNVDIYSTAVGILSPSATSLQANDSRPVLSSNRLTAIVHNDAKAEYSHVTVAGEPSGINHEVEVYADSASSGFSATKVGVLKKEGTTSIDVPISSCRRIHLVSINASESTASSVGVNLTLSNP